MARLVVTPAALDDLDLLIRTHSLPADTRDRLKRSLRPLAPVPRLGPELGGHFAGFRFVLGPWRWMLVIYVLDEDANDVAIVTIHDGGSSRAVTSPR